MASSAKYKKMTEEERKVHFMNIMLSECKFDFKKIDGEWYRRRVNGRGQWWPVVWEERDSNEYQKSA